jgi:hypothetical protein
MKARFKVHMICLLLCMYRGGYDQATGLGMLNDILPFFLPPY